MFKFSLEYEPGESIKITKDSTIGHQEVTVVREPGTSTYRFRQTWPDQPEETEGGYDHADFREKASHLIHIGIRDLHSLSHEGELAGLTQDQVSSVVDAIAAMFGLDGLGEPEIDPAPPKGAIGQRNAAFN